MCKSDSVEKLDAVSRGTISMYYRDALGIDTTNILNPVDPPIDLLSCVACDLRWYEPVLAGGPELYMALQRHQWYYQDDKPEYMFAKQFIRTDQHVLDIGCGKGAFSNFLPKGVTYRGLEFNEQAATTGRSIGLGISVESAECHAISNREAYDAVCHFQVLEHVSDPLSFLTACAAMLKPGGLLIVAVPSEDSFLSIAEDGYLNMPPHHQTRWTDQALGLAFRRIGIVPVECWHETVATYHRDWYRTVIAMYALRKSLGQDTHLTATDIISRVLRRLVRVKPIGDRLARIGEKQFDCRGRGHTVCMIGQKPR